MWHLDAALKIWANTTTQRPPQAHHSWPTRWGSPIQSPSRLPSTKSPVRQRSVQQNVAVVWQGTRQQHAREGLSYCCSSEATAVAFIFQPLLSPSQFHWGWRIHSSCAQWKRAAQLLSTAPLCPSHHFAPVESCSSYCSLITNSVLLTEHASREAALTWAAGMTIWRKEYHYSGKQRVLCLKLACEECKHPMTPVQNLGSFPVSYMDVKETWSSTISCYSVRTTTVIPQL